MEQKEEFTFRQRWFPTLGDTEDIARAKGYDYASGGDLMQFIGRWVRSLIVGSALLWGGYQAIGNNIQYSQGQRVGVINKVSEKGLIWKTKEGQLSLEGRTSTGEMTGAGVYDFSLDRQERHRENIDSLYSLIRQYMENGNRVKLTYIQPFATWPWRSETDYLVQSVEPLETQKK